MSERGKGERGQLGAPATPSRGLHAFVAESNRIEGINREPLDAEVDAYAVMLERAAQSLEGLERFVAVITEGKPLRRHVGLNVRIGAHTPPPGGQNIVRDLHRLLSAMNDRDLTPYAAHVAYEQLHPFMDGNGRSGRVLWAWMMHREGLDPFALPFLHRFYYQALDASRALPSPGEVEDEAPTPNPTA